MRSECVALCFELSKQLPPDGPRAHQPHRHRLLGQVEAGVGRAHGALGICLADHDRDVALGRALGAGAAVAPGAGQGAKETRSDARRLHHVVPYRRQDAVGTRDLRPLHLSMHQLGGKRPFHRLLCRLFLGHGDRHADAVLRAALGDQHHRHTGLPQRREHPAGNAGDTHHAGTLQVEERNAWHRREALHRRARQAQALGGRRRWPLADGGALGIRGQGVLDVDGNPALHGRTHGAGMQHRGARVGQLHGLVVGEVRQGCGLRDPPRVGAHDPVHVGPDGDGPCIQETREDRRGEVAAVAPQGGGCAAAVLGHVAGDHQEAGWVLIQPCGKPLGGLLPDHRRPGLVVLDHQHLPGVQPPGPMALLQQVTVQHGRRPCLAETAHQVPGAVGADPGDENPAQDVAKRIEFVGDLVTHRPRVTKQAGARVERALPQLVQIGGVALVVGGRQVRRLDQRIGHPGHGRDHHRHAVTVRYRTGDQTGSAGNALRVGEAGATELVNLPGGRCHGDTVNIGCRHSPPSRPAASDSQLLGVGLQGVDDELDVF